MDKPPVKIIGNALDDQCEELLERARTAEQNYKDHLVAMGQIVSAFKELLGEFFEQPIRLEVRDSQVIFQAGDGEASTLDEVIDACKTVTKLLIKEKPEAGTFEERVNRLEKNLRILALDYYPLESPKRKLFEKE